MRLIQLIPVALVVVLAALSASIGLLGDWLWFVSVGYDSVFLTILSSSVAIGLFSFIIFFGFSAVNVSLARRAAVGKRGKRGAGTARAVNMVALLVALAAAFAMAGSWETVLKYLNAVPFGAADPVFGMDIGFFVFSLPFYSLVLGFLLAVFVSAALLSVLTYMLCSSVLRERPSAAGWAQDAFGVQSGGGMELKWSGSVDKLVPQLSVLMTLIFVALSGLIYLSRYGLLLIGGDAVFGAGYTDVTVTMPMLLILSGLAFVTGILFMANLKLRKTRFIIYAVGAFAAVAFAGLIIAGAVQGLVVQPDEFNLEKPYLIRNIHGTLAAYGLDDAEEDVFPVGYGLTADDIEDNSATVNNIRLWDWRPLKQTYDQLQLFRTYYDFNDVDVDRYTIDGEYKQVFVSAREMDTARLQENARTWVNRHLVYTHGYGVVMNPVDRVTPEGLPEFYVKDIPPSSEHVSLDEPRIYYGEKTSDYAITGTSTSEFDYPSGSENIYTSYSGLGGVPLTDAFRRMIYAVKFGSVELLVSGSLTGESRLLMNRRIHDRASEIAPFLLYDSDPYVAVSEGRLYWILDAYTATDMYPYSEKVRMGRTLNYIRNSVKVVMDAYSGDVRFYVIEQDDPLIMTYGSIFPGLFRSIDEMPPDLKSHIRYPEVMFRVQAEIYSTYHMKDPMVFYNKEDVWVIPDEMYRGSREAMQPYYVIMKLPGEEHEEFILMIPFTPRDKENMIGWMAARSDAPNYGRLLVYQFSKQELTYGPMQVEARIDQDTEISQLITLWSQSGSSVVRGNTIVIPIEDSILYVEPLYLEATEKGTLPQLQKVIVSYGNRLAMQDTLSEAIGAIFGPGAPSEGGEEPPGRTDMQKLERIAELYDLAQEALADGELGEYQKYIDMIGSVLPG